MLRSGKIAAAFIISNNQWAISVPRREQTASQTLAQKSIAAGVPGEQVDGNDVIAVREVISDALNRARSGEGGTLIECLTYRLADHTTADDATRYREDEEVREHWNKEPLRRLRAHLADRHGWSKDDEQMLLTSVETEMEEAADAYLATDPEPATAIVDHLFHSLPRDLAIVRDALDNA